MKALTIAVSIVRWPADLWASRTPEFSVYAHSPRERRGVRPVVSRIRGRRAAIRAAERVVASLSRRYRVNRRFNHFA